MLGGGRAGGLLAAALMLPVSSSMAEPEELFPLWTGEARLSGKEDIPFVKNERVIIDEGKEGEYQFTLGADIISHDGVLVAQWGNSLVDENDKGSVVRGARSTDGGKTWTPPEMIAPGHAGSPRHCHGVLHSANGELWSFVAQHGLGSSQGRYKGLRSEAFQWDESVKAWVSRGTFGEEGFWPLNSPIRMKNGKWIMAGAVVGQAARAAVAINDGQNWTRWRIIEIPHPEGGNTEDSSETWGETALFVQDEKVTAVVRRQDAVGSLVSVSDDFGETWPALRRANLPLASSKPTAGTLSDGRHYLVAAYSPEKRGDRNTLVLALTRPGETTFSKMYRILDEKSHAPRMKGSGKRPQWGYPSACEFDGGLYVVYSVSKEDTGLSIIDLKDIEDAVQP